MANRRKPVVEGKRVCSQCKLPKSLDEFSGRADDPRYRVSACRSCGNKRKRIRAAEARAKLAAIKVGRGCADCGYNAHPAALDFDHLPGFVKLFNVGKMAHAYSWTKILEEVAKCEVVCSNCHRVRTYERLHGE